MNLLFRLLRFLARLIFIFFFHLIAAFTEFILLPMFLTTLRLMLTLMSFSFSATVNGPRQFIDRQAGEWTRQLIDLDDSREHINRIYSLCRLMAGTIIVLGWIVAGIFTVIFLRVYFAFFI